MRAKAKKAKQYVEREAIVDQIVDIIDGLNDQGKKDLADEAEVHWTTMYNWISGKVRKPRIDTLAKVARALGYDIALRAKHKARLRKV